MQNIPEAYQPIVKKIVSAMRRFLADGKELQAFTFLGKMDGRLEPIPMQMTSGMSKDLSASIVTMMAKEFKPDFVILVSEAWALERETPPEEIQAYLKKHTSLADHPNRQDIVMLNLETRHGIWMGMSPIKSLGGKSRGFDDLVFTKPDKMVGRFAHFLSPESDTRH